ncbi:MAG: ABC transporter permease [Caldilineaceae bacterium]
MVSNTLQQTLARPQRSTVQIAKQEHGMSFANTFRTAWEGITLNKLRSFLTTLGIIIGVAAVIIMLAVSAGAEAAISDQINGLGANLIMVTPFRAFGGVRPQGGGGFAGGFGGGDRGAGGAPGANSAFQYSDIAAIASGVQGISGVTVQQNTTQDVRQDGTTMTSVSIVGTTADFPSVRDYKVGSGRFFSTQETADAKRVAVIGYGIANNLFSGSDPIGQQVRIGSTSFEIVGVMAQQGVVNSTDNDGLIYIPVTTLFKKFTQSRVGGNQVRMILVKATSKDAMSDVIQQVTNLMAIRRNVDPASPNFSVSTQQDIINARASTTAAFRSLLGWVAGVSLVVGGIGIMNIMLVSVTERTREIGLRQALGARPWDVKLQFLIEAVMLSLVGGLVGLVAGVIGSYIFGQVGGMRTQIVPMSLPLAFLASASVGIFFGYYPATQAARLDPIEALRRE